MNCPYCQAEDNGVFYQCGTVSGSADQTSECRRVQMIVERCKRLEEILNRILDNSGSRNQFRALGLYDAQVDAEKLLAGVGI
jgi:hypothetical protein